MDKERKNLLVFGYGLALILSIVAIRLWQKHGLSANKIVLLSIAVVLLFITTFQLKWLKPIYTRWMKVTGFIGEIISALMLTVIFYGIFTIFGIMLRFLKKDLLDQKIRPESDTYWLNRESDSFDPKQYEQQF